MLMKFTAGALINTLYINNFILNKYFKHVLVTRMKVKEIFGNISRGLRTREFQAKRAGLFSSRHIKSVQGSPLVVPSQRFKNIKLLL